MSIRGRRVANWFVRFIWSAATVARAIDVGPTMAADACSTRGGEPVFIRAPLRLLHPMRVVKARQAPSPRFSRS